MFEIISLIIGFIIMLIFAFYSLFYIFRWLKTKDKPFEGLSIVCAVDSIDIICNMAFNFNYIQCLGVE